MLKVNFFFFLQTSLSIAGDEKGKDDDFVVQMQDSGDEGDHEDDAQNDENANKLWELSMKIASIEEYSKVI